MENGKKRGILCDWLWGDSIPCIFSHPDTIVIPREYAVALVVIPAYCICKYIQSVLSTPHALQRKLFRGFDF